MRLNLARRRPAFTGLTPLIDMIFLLLLFFLLGSDFVPFSQSQIAPPRGAGGASSASQPAILTLDAGGQVRWAGASLSLPMVTSRAAGALSAEPEKLFVVMPAAAANIQQVTRLMDALAAGGATSITLERDVFDIDLVDF